MDMDIDMDINKAVTDINFSHLPLDVIIYIIQRLDVQTFVALCNTNKFLRSKREYLTTFIIIEKYRDLDYYSRTINTAICCKLNFTIIQNILVYSSNRIDFRPICDKFIQAGARYNQLEPIQHVIDNIRYISNDTGLFHSNGIYQSRRNTIYQCLVIAIQHNSYDVYKYLLTKYETHYRIEEYRRNINDMHAFGFKLCHRHSNSVDMFKCSLDGCDADIINLPEFTHTFRYIKCPKIMHCVINKLNIQLEYILDTCHYSYNHSLVAVCNDNIVCYLFKRFKIKRKYADIIWLDLARPNITVELLRFLYKRFKMTPNDIKKYIAKQRTVITYSISSTSDEHNAEKLKYDNIVRFIHTKTNITISFLNLKNC